jgi:hypothetical protein
VSTGYGNTITVPRFSNFYAPRCANGNCPGR